MGRAGSWSNKRLNKLRTSEVLPRDESRAQSELLGLQATTCSPMGALVYGYGGIVVEGGWLRVLGSGCERMNRGIYGF